MADIMTEQRSTSTRTAAATMARKRAKAQRLAIEAADMLELVPDFVLTELSLVIIEELNRREAERTGGAT